MGTFGFGVRRDGRDERVTDGEVTSQWLGYRGRQR